MAPRRTRFAGAGVRDAGARDPQAFDVVPGLRGRLPPGPAAHISLPSAAVAPGPRQAPRPAQLPLAPRQPRRGSAPPYLVPQRRPAPAPPPAPAGLRGAQAGPSRRAPAQPLGGGRRAPAAVMAAARPACHSAAGGAGRGDEWVTVRRQCPCRGRWYTGLHGEQRGQREVIPRWPLLGPSRVLCPVLGSAVKETRNYWRVQRRP